MEYLVRWEIDVTADNPEEAAAKAWAVQRNNDEANKATVFDVVEIDDSGVQTGDWKRVDTRAAKANCRHCGRAIVEDPTEGWVDPEATGDDVIWRVSCDKHDTFTAEHEPEETP